MIYCKYILRQAVVLTAPYWIAEGSWKYRRFTKRRIARRITFLTFDAHWIDDHFDALERYCQNETLRQVIRRSSPKEILNTHNPRLDELLKGMEKAVLPPLVVRVWQGILSRLGLYKMRDPSLPLRVSMVERAVVRIVYGGLIQNAQCESRLHSLLQQYVDFVQNGLSDSLKSIYSDISKSDCPLAAWVLLYGPLLYYHDYKNEAAEERFGDAFRSTALPQIPHMLKMIDRCFTLMPAIFPNAKLNEGRKLQLRLLLSLYGDKEKAIKGAYSKFLT